MTVVKLTVEFYFEGPDVGFATRRSQGFLAEIDPIVDKWRKSRMIEIRHPGPQLSIVEPTKKEEKDGPHGKAT